MLVTSSYRDVLRLPGVLRLFLVSLVARVPHATTGVVLTLHVVTALGEGYARAGVVAAAMTVGLAIGAPWRGRLVDRVGLRRAVLPSVVVESGVWLAAPHLAYVPLIVAAFVAGVFLVPVFSVTRQSLAVLVPPAQQKAAYALDSVFTELTFMLGPVLGVLLVTQGSSTLALTVVGSATVAAGLLLLWANPPTRSVGVEHAPLPPGTRVLSAHLLVVLLAAAAASFVLMGTDVSLVAALNDAGRATDVGWMIALWAGGSAVGGLVHGASPRQPSPLLLVAVLAAATLPAAFVQGPVALAVAVFVAGLPCAPALSSINATLVRLVPEQRRGEVMGWSGTMQTVGNALGAPLCGWVIDRVGAGGGFLTAAVVGGGVAGLGLVVVAVRRRRPVVPAPADAVDDVPAVPSSPAVVTSPAAETPAEVVVDDPAGARDGATGADPQGRAPAAP
ncbi:MFS transporter [Cellulomonas sp. B6]|nr:MFS transporter [Cellulomonas sp. B6]